MNKKLIAEVVALVVLVGLALVVVKKPTLIDQEVNDDTGSVTSPLAAPSPLDIFAAPSDTTAPSASAPTDTNSASSQSGQAYVYINTIQPVDTNDYVIFDQIDIDAQGNVTNPSQELSGAPISPSVVIMTETGSVSLETFKTYFGSTATVDLSTKPFLLTVTNGEVTEIDESKL